MEELISKLERKTNSHKGENGKVLIVGGSDKYTGAPALAAKAALRSGADLVKILTSEGAKPVVQSFSENIIAESYGKKFDNKSLEKAQELEKWADVTVIGPGLTKFNREALQQFAEGAEDIVIDAEAIKPLLDTSGNIFTPHSGEAECIDEKSGSIKIFSDETGSTVLLKGEKDRIFSRKQIFENETGCATMTVGGTGDVLTGIVASLKAQDLEDVEAARLGAYVNGLAGEKAAESYDNGALPTDMIEFIPDVLYN